MQWLINIVVEAVIAQLEAQPSYIDRGDPAVYDYETGDLTIDGTWHDLDLSAIIPSNATAVLIGGFFMDDAVGKSIAFRKSGQSLNINISAMLTQVATVWRQGDFIVAASPNQKIEYNIITGMDSVFLVIRGWWI